MLVVADSSPLVALAAAESLDLLDQLFYAVRIPPAVQAELLVPGKPHYLVLQEFLRGRVLPVDLSRYVIAAPGLGSGELEAMALYKALAADQLLVDDERARKVARLNSIQVVGSLGVLLLAKGTGLITAITPRIDAMRSAGIYMSETVVRDALRLAGE
jgi:predicted nucleic acid-binding protein